MHLRSLLSTVLIFALALPVSAQEAVAPKATPSPVSPVQNRLNSISDTTPPPAETPASPPKTTVSDLDKKPFNPGEKEKAEEDKENPPGLFNGLITHRHAAYGVGAFYLGAKFLVAREAEQGRAAMRAQLAGYERSFPGGVSNHPRLKPHLERLEALEANVGRQISEIREPGLRKATLESFGSEVCENRLGQLADAAKARLKRSWSEGISRQYRRYTRGMRNFFRGTSMPPAGAPQEAVEPSTPVAGDEALIRAIEADRTAMHDAYKAWYREVEAMKPELDAVTGQKFVMPAHPETLFQKAEGGLRADHRALRDGMDDFNRFLAADVARLHAGSKQTVVEQIPGAAAATYRQAGSAASYAYHTDVRDAARHGMAGAKEAFGTVKERAAQGFASAREGWQAAREGMTVKNLWNNGVGGTLAFAGNTVKAAPKRALEIMALGALTYIAMSHRSQVAALKAEQSTKNENMANTNRELAPSPDKELARLENKFFILATTQIWKTFESAGDLKLPRDSMPFLLKEEGLPIDFSDNAAQNMANLRAEAVRLAPMIRSGDGKASQMEMLWSLILQKAEDIDVSLGAADQKEYFDKNKGLIQHLAIETKDYIHKNPQDMEKLREFEAEAKAEAEAAAKKQADEEKIKKMAEENAAAEAVEAAKKLPMPVVPMTTPAPTPEAKPVAPMADVKPMEAAPAPKLPETPAPQNP